MINPAAKKKKIAHGLVALGLTVPTKEVIKDLPAFDTSKRRSVIINNTKALRQAALELAGADIIGFDTETKPNFEKGQTPNPIALLQLATDKVCFMIQPLQLANKIIDMEPIRLLLQREDILKVGAGLKADKKLLKREFDVQLNGIVDLVSAFNALGYKNDMGVKTMIAMLSGQQLKKSKRLSRSNWAMPVLSPEQCRYASDDAFAPVDVYRKLISITRQACNDVNRSANVDIYIAKNRALRNALGL
tara:strand:- start:4048 stop:4788 length:741 start_codon:yes stop_codon:yes gene_type:complete